MGGGRPSRICVTALVKTRRLLGAIIVVVEYYYILIIIIVVGPGAWLPHSAAEGYRFLSNIVATLARNADPPIWLLGGCCLLPSLELYVLRYFVPPTFATLR